MVKIAFQPDKLASLADPREMPAYTTPEAAAALWIPESTIRAWFFGQGAFEAVLSPPIKGRRELSFNNLVEAFALRTVRIRYGISMPRVRRALDRVASELRSPRPLLTASFKTDGVALFLEAFLGSEEADSGQRLLFDDHLERVEFDDGVASRLYPMYGSSEDSDRRRAVAIDYRKCFGRPMLTRIGVPTGSIYDRWWAGESIESLVADFRCTIRDVDEALRFERYRKAA